MPLSLDEADVYVLLKLVAKHGTKWVQSGIAHELGVSPSVVNRALKKAEAIGLYNPIRKRVNARPLHDALAYGAKVFLAPVKGGEARGIPTAWAAPPLDNAISTSEALPFVWPDPMGSVRGLSIEPLHPSAPRAATMDLEFYEILALVDALRLGGAREKALANEELKRKMMIKSEQ